MITSEELSLSQQARGRKALLSFSFLNGIALTFITGNVLSLYLLKVGCSTPIVAVIASFGYLGTLFALVGKNSISKFGVGLTLRITWILCGFFAIFIALIPFLEYAALNKYLELFLITVVIFLFFVFKSIGTATTQPLMGEFTDDDNHGEFSSRYFLCYTIANVLAMLCVIGFYSWHKTLIIYQMIIFFGGIIIIICSCLLIGVKETETPRNSAKLIVTKKLLSIIWKDKQYRNFLFIRSFSRAILILIVPISILALKKMYGVSDQIALFFAFVQLIGGILITYLNGVVAEETGPKPLLIIYIMLLFAISLMWIIAPNHFNPIFCFIIFLIGGISLYGIDANLNHFYLTIIPKENSVGISLWYTVIGGAIAGIAGLIFGGGLIKFSILLVSRGNVFRLYYAVMFLLMIPVLYIVYRQKSPSSWKLRKVLKLFISLKDLQTLYVLHKQNKFSNASTEFDDIIKLGGLNSELSQKRLLYYLDSPRYFIKLEALRSLIGKKLSEQSIEAVFHILKHNKNSGAHLAAVMIAQNNVKKAIPTLRKYLDDEDQKLLAFSMFSLVLIGDKESYSRIIKIFKTNSSSYVLIWGAWAISRMNDKKKLKILLGRYIEENIKVKSFMKNLKKNNLTELNNTARILKEKNGMINNEILCSAAALVNVNNIFYEFLRIYNHHHKQGILYIIEKLNNTDIDNGLANPQQIIMDYSKGNIGIGEFLDYIKISAELLKDNPVAPIISDILNSVTHKQTNVKFLYCLFVILFCEKSGEYFLNKLPSM
jgi:hypothetical protein